MIIVSEAYYRADNISSKKLLAGKSNFTAKDLAYVSGWVWFDDKTMDYNDSIG